MVAIDLITEHIRMKLQQPDLRRIYHNLEVIPSNFQTRGMHTIIRNRDTTTNDFVFYSDRLLRLVRASGPQTPAPSTFGFSDQGPKQVVAAGDLAQPMLQPRTLLQGSSLARRRLAGVHARAGQVCHVPFAKSGLSLGSPVQQ